jgi:hypothetical protein
MRPKYSKIDKVTMMYSYPHPILIHYNIFIYRPKKNAPKKEKKLKRILTNDKFGIQRILKRILFIYFQYFSNIVHQIISI